MPRVTTLQPGLPRLQAEVAIVGVHHPRLDIQKLESFLHRPPREIPGIATDTDARTPAHFTFTR